ncbi:hypothetical protein [Xanthomonas citri]|uniref:hypothetical protein n=1 Tax=Xanthomonas citri TaxID=346 RepID=UPI0002FBF57B|nr:hypothetical protein [Xanthomonas citri]AMU97494.1 hypothetical protein TP37_04735 [Xanthomonas citri pv. aurantifolii]AMV01924.1 hypothetical protein TP50_05230 [Xanthomonas citri pv. aurantifolii]MCC8488364.1 hypothetical protein [Xanthomonas citri pv. fuscans]TBW98864.1 hypothetical protein TP47_07365 [Xanthomonas citri pv. aurantifolii]TBX00062.1 hypothetical protein TP49_02195 [Xanthomonas citri pv. aurantifolii]
MTEPLRPALSRLWSSEPDGGMSLQLSASIEGRQHEVMTVLGDPRDEALWVAVQAGSTRVQISLEVLRKALDVAAEDVHSAEWFARQNAAASDV